MKDYWVINFNSKLKNLDGWQRRLCLNKKIEKQLNYYIQKKMMKL